MKQTIKKKTEEKWYNEPEERNKCACIFDIFSIDYIDSLIFYQIHLAISKIILFLWFDASKSIAAIFQITNSVSLAICPTLQCK